MAIPPGAAVLLMREDGKRNYLARPVAGRRVAIEGGDIVAEEILSREFGESVVSPSGERYWLLPATTADLMQKAERRTQILYAKDAGYLLLRLDIGPGTRVAEMGTGSGAMTLALARLVGDTGRVYSYDERPEHQEVASKNLTRANLAGRVEMKTRSAGEPFDETDLDAVFLDLPEPWRAGPPAHKALRLGAPLALIVPTVEQLKEASLTLRRDGFFVQEETEIFQRRLKVRDAAGVRPEDRMIGHTGYLLLARAVNLRPKADESPR